MSDTEESEYDDYSSGEDDTPEQTTAERIAEGKARADKSKADALALKQRRAEVQARLKLKQEEEAKRKLEERSKARKEAIKPPPLPLGAVAKVEEEEEWTTPQSPFWVSSTQLYDQDTPISPFYETQHLYQALPYIPDTSFMDELERKEIEINQKYPKSPTYNDGVPYNLTSDEEELEDTDLKERLDALRAKEKQRRIDTDEQAEAEADREYFFNRRNEFGEYDREGIIQRIADILIREDGAIADDVMRGLNQTQIVKVYLYLKKRQDSRDVRAQMALERVEAYYGRPSKASLEGGGNVLSLKESDATPEFLARIQDAIETPESKAEEEKALAEEADAKRIRQIHYAKGNVPDFPWTEAQIKRYHPKTAGVGEYSQASERIRNEENDEFAEKYGAYDPTANAKLGDKFDAFAGESEDEFEDDPDRMNKLHERGLAYYAGEATEMVAPLPWETDREILDKWASFQAQKQADKIAEQEQMIRTLKLALPSTASVPFMDELSDEESDGLITDDEGDAKEAEEAERKRNWWDAEEAERERVRQLVANAPAIRPDLEALARMGQGKHGKRKERVIFPDMPPEAYVFTTEGKSYGEDTKKFLEQQRDAMLAMRTPEHGRYEAGIQFTSMFPMDATRKRIDRETNPNAEEPKLGKEIIPWLVEGEHEEKMRKAEERSRETREMRQRDYDEDKATFLTDKKLFTKKVKVKRAEEEKALRTMGEELSFNRSFGFRKKKGTTRVKGAYKKAVAKAVEKPPTPPPPSPPPSPKKKPPSPPPVAPPRKRRGIKKKLTPVRKAPDPPKKPTHPVPTRPPPRRPPTKAPPPKPQAQGQKKRATRSDKGTHHKWSDGRENSATYKKNKAKGVDWSAVRCRASTCWEVGDRKTDAKGTGAFKKNESSGEYKKQLREKPKKKKKKKEEERREEDGWF